MQLSQRSYNLASIDPQTKQQVGLFHRRSDDWNVRFKVEAGGIIGLTPTGRATARLQNTNASRLVWLHRDRELMNLSEF